MDAEEERELVRLKNLVGDLQRNSGHLEQNLEYERNQSACLHGTIQDLEARARAARTVIDALQLEIRGYIEQDVIAGGKYKSRLEAATQELRLITKAGLTSGCGCPIGKCLNYGSSVLAGACWFQWAEAHVLKRRAEIRLDEIYSQANHPARIAAANRARTEDPKP